MIADLSKFSLEKIEVVVPSKIEAVWAIARPKITDKEYQFKEIICAAFYSPPNKRKNSTLIDHICTTAQHLLTKYPKAGIILGGDKNSMPISPVLDAIPKSHQIVT